MRFIKSFILTLTAIMITVLLLPSLSNAQLDNGLVAYYPFNGDTIDATGNGNDATNYGATLTTDRYGNVNSAYHFNGTSEYMDCGNGISLQIANDITVTAWIKSEFSTDHSPEVISKYGTGDAGWILSTFPDSTAAFQGRDNSGNYRSSGKSYKWNGDWHFLVGQREGSIWKIYVDGTLHQSIDAGTTGSLIASNNMQIGVQSGAGSRFFMGTIDDIRIYNRALSSAEILQLYYELNKIEISLTADTIAQNDTITIPVRVNFKNGKSYNSAQVNFLRNTSALQFVGLDVTNTLVGNAGWSYDTNQTNGVLRTAFAGAQDISGDSVLFKLKFKATGAICTSFPITIDSVLFGTGGDSVVKTNGSVYIEAKPVYGDVDGNGSIQAEDAAQVLLELADSITLGCQGLANANVSCDNSVSTQDASNILKFVVQKITSLPDCGTLQATGILAMSNFSIQPNSLTGVVEIPLYLSNGSNIYGFEGEITYDPAQLTYTDVQWSSSLDSFSKIAIAKNGTLKFVGAGSEQDGQTGLFAMLRFTGTSNFTGTTVTFTKLRWNENENLYNLGSLILEPMSVSTTVEQNWNMVSVPIIMEDYQKNSLFPTSTSNAFAYDNGYVVTNPLKVGQGYWLKFAGTEAVGFSGIGVKVGRIPVKSGWNMIGSISSSVPVSTITSEPNSIVTTQFFGYNNGYSASETIEPGKGYWVKVNQAGTLILSSSTTMSAVNRITIVPTNELPPSPPEGEVNNNNSIIPSEFSLAQNYPNPFNPSTVIRYQLPVTTHVNITVFNTLGQVVSTLVNGVQEAGYKSVEWDASNIQSGMYFYRLSAGNFVETRKLLLVK